MMRFSSLLLVLLGICILLPDNPDLYVSARRHAHRPNKLRHRAHNMRSGYYPHLEDSEEDLKPERQARLADRYDIDEDIDLEDEDGERNGFKDEIKYENETDEWEEESEEGDDDYDMESVELPLEPTVEKRDSPGRPPKTETKPATTHPPLKATGASKPINKPATPADKKAADKKRADKKKADKKKADKQKGDKVNAKSRDVKTSANTVGAKSDSKHGADQTNHPNSDGKETKSSDNHSKKKDDPSNNSDKSSEKKAVLKPTKQAKQTGDQKSSDEDAGKGSKIEKGSEDEVESSRHANAEKKLMDLSKQFYYTLADDIADEVVARIHSSDQEQNSPSESSASESGPDDKIHEDADKPQFVINVPESLGGENSERVPESCLSYNMSEEFPVIYLSRGGKKQAVYNDDDHSGSGYLVKGLNRHQTPNKDLALEFKFPVPISLLAINFPDADDLQGTTEVVVQVERVEAGKWTWVKGVVGEGPRVFRLGQDWVKMDLVSKVSGVRIFPQKWVNQPIIPRPEFLQCNQFEEELDTAAYPQQGE